MENEVDVYGGWAVGCLLTGGSLLGGAALVPAIQSYSGIFHALEAASVVSFGGFGLCLALALLAARR